MSCTTNDDCSNHGICNVTCKCYDNYKGSKCEQCVSDDYQMTKQGFCAKKCSFICDEDHQNCETDPDFGIDLCVCDDSNASPDDKCKGCLTGYHKTEYDHCQPDSCVKNFKMCENLGDCDEVDGKFQCVCPSGFAGKFCEECTNGLTKTRDGQCLPADCVNQFRDECSGKGICVTATRQCTCNHGYAGKSCFQCATGFTPIRTTYEVTCYPDICFVGYNPKICSGNGKCITQGTETFCECNRGIGGPQCQDCATDYEKLPNGQCVSAKCVTNGKSCDNHGICDYANGSYYCKCWPKFDTKEKCGGCLAGFVLQKDDCVSNSCISGDIQCNNHGTCEKQSYFNEIYTCKCEFGYSGEFCKDCNTGFLAADNGDCINPKCISNEIECSNNGMCVGSQKNGWACSCNLGAFGDKCQSCSRDYQMTKSGKCVIQDCFADNQECGGNGFCDNSSWSHKCNCNENFAIESRCVDCVIGYSLKDGACVEPNTQISVGAIAGIAIAIAVVLIAIGLGIWFIAKGKKGKTTISKVNNVPKDRDFGGSVQKNRSGSNNFI